MKKQSLCKQCTKQYPTYEVKLNGRLLFLCDYCYYVLKWKNPEKKFIVESHLVTKKGVDNRIKAIKKYLLPRMRKKIDKKLATQLLNIEKQKGGDELLTKIREKPNLAKFLAKNNISYYELIKCLSLLTKH